MADDIIYIAFPKQLYNDIVRFSDDTIDPSSLASDLIESWIARSVEFFDENNWGDHAEDVAMKYAPDVVERWAREDMVEADERKAENQPLVWKNVTVPAGSQVRMSYGGKQHYADVKRGRIIDGDQEYTPSEWASKVADGTSRNAWRDLWFKEPLSKTWTPAQLLREQAKAAMAIDTSDSRED